MTTLVYCCGVGDRDRLWAAGVSFNNCAHMVEPPGCPEGIHQVCLDVAVPPGGHWALVCVVSEASVARERTTRGSGWDKETAANELGMVGSMDEGNLKTPTP